MLQNVTSATSDISVSIVVPTLNSMRTLPSLVNALLGQLDASHHELLFLDSESDDDTVDFISGIPFPRVSVHRIRRAEFSHSRTRMLGAELSRGRLVVFFSDDIVPIGRSFLATLCQPVLKGHAAACFGVSQIPPSTADPLRAHRYNGWYLKRPRLVSPITHNEWQTLSPERRFYLCRFDDCAACYERETLLTVRFPDIPYGEDIAVAKEFLLSGHAIALAKEASFYHWHHISFNYQLQRMCIEQVVLKELFELELMPNITKLFVVTTLQSCLYTFIGLTLPGISLGKRLYWIGYSYRYILGDNLGKYLGCLEEDSISRWNILVRCLANRKKKICDKVLSRSLKCD